MRENKKRKTLRLSFPKLWRVCLLRNCAKGGCTTFKEELYQNKIYPYFKTDFARWGDGQLKRSWEKITPQWIPNYKSTLGKVTVWEEWVGSIDHCQCYFERVSLCYLFVPITAFRADLIFSRRFCKWWLDVVSSSTVACASRSCKRNPQMKTNDVRNRNEKKENKISRPKQTVWVVRSHSRGVPPFSRWGRGSIFLMPEMEPTCLRKNN